MHCCYNEIDKNACRKLKKLISGGVISPGTVDQVSIEDLIPSELNNFTQCHFFAGIGVWSYALNQAGWPKDEQVWTGSCPCQPFSTAGKRDGFNDSRHLWPALFWHIKQCHPNAVFGEQVASSDGVKWLDTVSNGLESIGYTVGAAITTACGAGAPHKRRRIYWVALEHSHYSGCWANKSERDSTVLRGKAIPKINPRDSYDKHQTPRKNYSTWKSVDWIKSLGRVWRPIEPGTCPMAYGTAGHVGLIKGYGNALVAPQARMFIEAVMDCLGMTSNWHSVVQHRLTPYGLSADKCSQSTTTIVDTNLFGYGL